MIRKRERKSPEEERKIYLAFDSKDAILLALLAVPALGEALMNRDEINEVFQMLDLETEEKREARRYEIPNSSDQTKTSTSIIIVKTCMQETGNAKF